MSWNGRALQFLTFLSLGDTSTLHSFAFQCAFWIRYMHFKEFSFQVGGRHFSAVVHFRLF